MHFINRFNCFLGADETPFLTGKDFLNDLATFLTALATTLMAFFNGPFLFRLLTEVFEAGFLKRA